MAEKNKKGEKDMTIGELAQIVTSGFENVDKRFEKLDEQIDKKLEKMATSIQGEFLKLKEDIDGVKSDTEDIKAELNKKVDRIEHNELVYRVERLEKKCA